MSLPNERAAASLRLEGPALGLGLEQQEVGHYLDVVSKGLLIPETPCDMGMQNNWALRADTTTTLSSAAS
ncbi:hypothetical protein [Nonomuraea sp. NPDC049400]|uniref:hypothetical protein n=1 Tax=Nonomuraea sp. NPDC049400 TaxID=3364352 RepID=UPI0037B7E5EE